MLIAPTTLDLELTREPANKHILILFMTTQVNTPLKIQV